MGAVTHGASGILSRSLPADYVEVDMKSLLADRLINIIRKTLQRIGASENQILRVIAVLIRFPIKTAQLRLLNIQKERSIISLVGKIQKEKNSLMWPIEMVQIYNCASLAKKLPGDFVEVGVYLGRSAKLICEAKGDKQIHLFDTFEGLPKPEPIDGKTFHEKQYAARLDSVKTYLSNYKNVDFHQGFFPKTAEPIKRKSFAFVHLDVDLYHTTLACLEFFYPRMVRGGIILSHDYSTSAGVKKAFDDFFADKTELVIELSTSQCLVVKL